MITNSLPTLHYKDLLDLSVLLLIDSSEKSASMLLEKLVALELIKAEGVLFPILVRMKSEGLITAREVEAENTTPRKFYSITDAGREELDRLQALWLKLEQQMNELMQRKSEL
jgi:PadR family transcriptional regulator PadR